MSTPNSRMASLSDIRSLEAIPFSERETNISPYQVIANSAERFTDKIALRYDSCQSQTQVLSYSYGDLISLINQTANALVDLGANSKNSVAILLPNLPHTHFALWGAVAVSRANPINPMLEAEHIADIMNAAETRVLVTLAPHKDFDIWQKARQLVAQVPSLTAILTVDLYRLHSQPTPAAHQLPEPAEDSVVLYDFDERLAGYSSELQGRSREINRERQTDDTAVYFHTGGTTGKPKLARHSHHNQVTSAWQIATMLDINSDDVVLCGLPLSHVNAVFVSGLVPFYRGSEVLIASSQGFREPAVLRAFWALVEKYKISVFSGVPTVISALMDVPIDGRDVSSLRVALSGAAPLPIEIKHRFESSTGLTIVEGYGQTEGTCGTSMNPLYGLHKAGSVGLPAPYVELRIVTLDTDGRILKDCQTDEIGTVAIKGPNVFQGYHTEKESAKVWLGDGWLNTGDLGRQDKDGYLWLTGRSKELIIRGGHNIDPSLIEEALCQHPAVASVAAVGKPDSRVGELPIAYVELRQGASATEAELLTLAGHTIPERAAVPKEIHIIDAMPLTAVGKVFKPTLRRDAIRRVCIEELGFLNVTASDYSVAVENYPQFGDTALISLRGDCHAPKIIAGITAALSRYAFNLELHAETSNDDNQDCHLEAVTVS